MAFPVHHGQVRRSGIYPAVPSVFAIVRYSGYDDGVFGRTISRSFHEIEPKGTKWHWWSFFGIAGNIILMMFYTTIAGWMFIYFYKYVAGSFSSMSAAEVGQAFEKMTGDPVVSTIAMGIAVVLGFAVCSLGVKEGRR